MNKSYHPPYASENEGKIVVSGRHTFRIINGVRVWLSPVPYQQLPDIVTNPYCKDNA